MLHLDNCQVLPVYDRTLIHPVVYNYLHRTYEFCFYHQNNFDSRVAGSRLIIIKTKKDYWIGSLCWDTIWLRKSMTGSTGKIEWQVMLPNQFATFNFTCLNMPDYIIQLWLVTMLLVKTTTFVTNIDVTISIDTNLSNKWFRCLISPKVPKLTMKCGCTTTSLNLCSLTISKIDISSSPIALK